MWHAKAAAGPAGSHSQEQHSAQWLGKRSWEGQLIVRPLTAADQSYLESDMCYHEGAYLGVRLVADML